MKIRMLKKLLKQQRIKTSKQRRQFSKALPHCKSIRNRIYTGMIRAGFYAKAAEMMLRFHDLKMRPNWIVI